MAAESTLTTFGDSSRRASGAAPFLFLLVECERPAAGSVRYRLDRVDTVVFGRGPARGAEIGAEGRARVLRIALDDRRVSSEHDSQWTRTDTYASEFLIPFIDAWSGPCRLDGVCVTEGCRTPDPDCAPCGIDGICTPGCPELDLDCPVGELFGAACTGHDDCESRRCIEDPHGEHGQYCARRCPPDGACPFGSSCAEVGGEMLCLLDPIPEEGRSGGGCAVTSQHRPGGLLLLVVALCFAFGSRGRRRA
jgi:hypothetical protein